jgi:hypothetical protein
MAIASRYRLLENGDKRLLESGDFRLLEAAYDPYKGYDVFPFRPNWVEPPKEQLHRSMTTLENQTGLQTVRSHTVTPIGFFDMLLTLEGRDEITAFRHYIKTLRGRWKPIWVPSWQSDLKPTANFSGSSITVESVGYAGYLFPHNGRKHLAIIRHDGVIYVRGVNSASDNGTTETIGLKSSVGVTIYASSCLVCFLHFARLAEDRVVTRWIGKDLAEARIGWVELPREVPAP